MIIPQRSCYLHFISAVPRYNSTGCPPECFPKAKCYVREDRQVGIAPPQQWARVAEAQVTHGAGGGFSSQMINEVSLCCYFGTEGSGGVLPSQGQVSYKPVQQPQPWNQRKCASQNISVFNLCLSRRALITPPSQQLPKR